MRWIFQVGSAIITNASKALVIAAINAGLACAIAFGVKLTVEQMAAVITFVDTVLALWIAMTYKDSPTRIRDDAPTDIRIAALKK